MWYRSSEDPRLSVTIALLIATAMVLLSKIGIGVGGASDIRIVSAARSMSTLICAVRSRSS